MAKKKTRATAGATSAASADGRIKRSTVNLLIEQNRAMRELLISWPAREIMMDYEKEWNEQRQNFLDQNPELKL